MKRFDYFNFYVDVMANPLPEMVRYFNENQTYLASLVDRDSVVLDIGCGNGHNMKFLSPKVKRIVGIDIDSRMIKLAQENLKGLVNVELKTGDFAETNFEEKFDLVFASFNLIGSPHFTDDERPAVLKKILDTVRDGGRLVVDFWSDVGSGFARKYYTEMGCESVEIRDGQPWVKDFAGEIKHMRRWSKKEIEEFATQVSDDFEIVDLAGIFYLLDIKK